MRVLELPAGASFVAAAEHRAVVNLSCYTGGQAVQPAMPVSLQKFERGDEKSLAFSAVTLVSKVRVVV